MNEPPEVVDNYVSLEGGPFDGVEIKWAGDAFIGDVILSIPRHAEGDKKEHMRGLELHRYFCTSSTLNEAGRYWHTMHYDGCTITEHAKLEEFLESQ